MIKNGVFTIDAGTAYEGGYQYEIKFTESQITALGYNYSSITGNVFYPVLDPETDLYFYPWIVNIYISKL